MYFLYFNSGNAKRIDGKIPTSSSSTSNADGIASSQSSSSSGTAGGAAPPTSVFQAKSDRAKYFEEKFANSAPANGESVVCLFWCLLCVSACAYY
jgi:hypothetical protein